MKDKGNIIWLITGALVILGMLLMICWMSAMRAANNEWGSGWLMSMKEAGLRNTITLSGDQVEELELTYSSQNISFFTSDSEDIIIKEYLRSNREDAKATVSLNGGRAVITGGSGINFGMFRLNMGGWERIEVYLPDKLFQRVSVLVSSGNVTAQEKFVLKCRNLLLQTTSGNIRWEGSIWAEETGFQVTSGNISLKDIEGVVNVEASSGNITLDRISGSGTLEAKSGNIRVAAENITGDLSMEANSGNIKLALPKGLQFHFTANTSSGNIKTDFDNHLSYNEKGNQAEGDVGENPTIQIDMRARSGNVRAVY